MSIQTISTKETQLAHMLQVCSEALKAVTAERDALRVNRDEYQVAADKLAWECKTLRDALESLVEIINKAGLSNLSGGVQLGQISWYVKASDRLNAAGAALKGENT